MHPKLRALLVIPLALSLVGTAADAKKKKKKKPAEAAEPAASPAPETPPPAAAAPATETPPASASASAGVSVGASVEATPVAPAATSPIAETTTPATAAAPTPPPPPKDGVRFRGGISLGGGGEFVSGFTAGLGALDGRLGVQINKLVGVYVQPHVSFGSGTVGSVSGPTGSAAAAVMADFTFINRIFVGAGAGYGVVNAPHGAVVALRFGGYPVLKTYEDRPRRKGLMVGADLRTFFTQVGPVVQVIASVGYEAF